MELPFAESWKIKMIEPLRKSTRAEREQWLKEAHNNVFMLKAEQVYIDCLTDSGTGAMSDRQWSEMMLGDESYAGATSFYKFESVVQRIFGFKYVIPPTSTPPRVTSRAVTPRLSTSPSMRPRTPS